MLWEARIRTSIRNLTDTPRALCLAPHSHVLGLRSKQTWPFFLSSSEHEPHRLLRRLYREWEELRGSIMSDRGRPVSAEEGNMLRGKGLAALDALLHLVTERVLEFVAPGSASREVGTPSSCRRIFCDTGIDALDQCPPCPALETA